MPREKLYKNLTLTERIVNYMLNNGYNEIPSKNKYRMFSKVGKDNKLLYYFVGSNGAVRVNLDKNASSSFSVTERFKERLAKWETENGL